MGICFCIRTHKKEGQLFVADDVYPYQVSKTRDGIIVCYMVYFAKNSVITYTQKQFDTKFSLS